jgi:hypothetical protein
MKVALAGAVLALALLAAGAAAAGGQSVQTTLAGKCSATDQLDANGALLSTTIVCNATGSCKCAGATKLVYSATAREPGNGANGHETGTLVASGPTGTVTLTFKGTRTALGQATGSWTLGTVKGFKGVRMARRGTYALTTKTISQIVGTQDTMVRISATLSPWLPAS